VKVGDAGLPGAAIKQVPQPGDRERPTLTDPQRVHMGEPVARPDAQVAIQPQGGLAAEGQGPLSPALADHPHHVVLEVEVLQAHAEQLGPASASTMRRAVSRRASKSLPPQTANNARSWGSVSTGTGWSGTAGGFILAIGLGRSSSSSSQR
jgi:hypothetical protein